MSAAELVAGMSLEEELSLFPPEDIVNEDLPRVELTDDGSGALIRLHVADCSKLTERVISEPIEYQGVTWRLVMMPRTHSIVGKPERCLGIFLLCTANIYSEENGWSCTATGELRLVTQSPNRSPSFLRRTQHTYVQKANDFGYTCFMMWHDVMNEDMGYIKGDSIHLEARVKASPATNILTREDFCCTVRKWIELANRQLSKNSLDLAIEANRCGLNFCNHRDDEEQKKLEQQRDMLTQLKLVQSIERIENGYQQQPALNIRPAAGNH